MWEEEKILFTSIFSFSLYVLYPMTDQYDII